MCGQQKKVLDTVMKKLNKGKGKAPVRLAKVVLTLTEEWPAWQKGVLSTLHEYFKEGAIPENAVLLARLKKNDALAGANMKEVMPFVQMVKTEAADLGELAFELKLPFDERQLYEEAKEYIAIQFGVPEVIVRSVEDLPEENRAAYAAAAAPGKPKGDFIPE